MKITSTIIVNTVLTAVLLSSVLFIGLTGSVGVYDPYADYDADGDVDIFDVVPMADAYGTEGDPSRNITITNLPLDEDGCIKTRSVARKQSFLVYNGSLTLPSSTSKVYLTTINVTGYSFIWVAANVEGTWQTGAAIYVSFYHNNYGIRNILRNFGLEAGIETHSPSYGSGQSGEYEIFSEAIDLYFQVYNSNVGFDGTLTIVVVLTK